MATGTLSTLKVSLSFLVYVSIVDALISDEHSAFFFSQKRYLNSQGVLRNWAWN